MKTLARVFLCASLAALSSVAFAQPMPAGEDHSKMLTRLGLTADQAKQVGDLISNEQLAVVPQRAQLKVYNAQIELAMTATSPDLKAVNALVDKKAELRTGMEKQFLSVEAQIHQIVGDKLFNELRRGFLEHHRRMAGMQEGGWGMRDQHPVQRPDHPAQPAQPKP